MKDMIANNRLVLAGLITGLLSLLIAAGCSTVPGSITSAQVELPKDEGSAGYLDRIASQETVSQDDAMRGILMLLDGQDEAETFAQRVSKLRQRGIVPESWDSRGDRPITRGKMAYMVYQAANVPGGVTLTLLGPSQRYCLRELQYQGFITEESAWYGEVTGMEFVAILTRADAFMETGEVPRVLYAAKRR